LRTEISIDVRLMSDKRLEIVSGLAENPTKRLFLFI
jgi:hypothetical protein